MYENVLEFQRENYPVESQLLAPDSDSTIAILEDTVPPGTTVDIEVSLSNMNGSVLTVEQKDSLHARM
jgi:hypothetical protein